MTMPDPLGQVRKKPIQGKGTADERTGSPHDIPINHLVRRTGLEPVRPKPADFKSAMSTNSITRAWSAATYNLHTGWREAQATSTTAKHNPSAWQGQK
ncbi:MAG: hypothetical protein RL695_2357 [Pseudomonadota bacterium]